MAQHGLVLNASDKPKLLNAERSLMRGKTESSCFGWLLSLLAALLLLPQAGFSQQVTAAISGQVTDPAGAAVAAATVEARELDRGTVQKTQTNVEGLYRSEEHTSELQS